MDRRPVQMGFAYAVARPYGPRHSQRLPAQEETPAKNHGCPQKSPVGARGFARGCQDETADWSSPPPPYRRWSLSGKTGKPAHCTPGTETTAGQGGGSHQSAYLYARVIMTRTTLPIGFDCDPYRKGPQPALPRAGLPHGRDKQSSLWGGMRGKEPNRRPSFPRHRASGQGCPLATAGPSRHGDEDL